MMAEEEVATGPGQEGAVLGNLNPIDRNYDAEAAHHLEENWAVLPE